MKCLDIYIYIYSICIHSISFLLAFQTTLMLLLFLTTSIFNLPIHTIHSPKRCHIPLCSFYINISMLLFLYSVILALHLIFWQVTLFLSRTSFNFLFLFNISRSVYPPMLSVPIKIFG